MSTHLNVIHQRLEERSVLQPDREQLAQLLKHAFPLSESGSFAGVLDSIREEAIDQRR
jgi:hypothetical protein